MRCGVHKQTLLDSIYMVKEKWAECFMRWVFNLGVRSTQLSEIFNNSLKNHCGIWFAYGDIFDRRMEVKWNKELESEFKARKTYQESRWAPLCRYRQLASQVYSPTVFEAIQREYERSMVACTKVLDGNYYVISIAIFQGELMRMSA
jgi:zinc finger SWIM domain-containing protein 3